jgi:hypothetical protein
MFMINLHTNSYIPSLNYSSVIVDKLKSKYTFCTATELLCILQNLQALIKAVHLIEMYYVSRSYTDTLGVTLSVTLKISIGSMFVLMVRKGLS